jgi:hypothetical protein
VRGGLATPPLNLQEMSPTSPVEACVQRLLALLPFYVRSDVRGEVRDVVVPYLRTGEDENQVTDYLALSIKKNLIRHGFYKLVKDLRRGKCDVESSYEDEYNA